MSQVVTTFQMPAQVPPGGTPLIKIGRHRSDYREACPTPPSYPTPLPNQTKPSDSLSLCNSEFIIVVSCQVSNEITVALKRTLTVPKALSLFVCLFVCLFFSFAAQ